MVFDGHSDIWTDVTIKTLEGKTNILKQYHLPRLAAGNVEGSIFVIWIDPPYTNNQKNRSQQIISAIKKESAACDEIRIVNNYAEIQQAKKENKFYVIIGLEGITYIGEDLSEIDRLYDFGARHAILAWNEQNQFATGVTGDINRGLTKLGKTAVRKIQDKHMLLDVSHLNDKSFWDVMDLATQPIIASHSNARRFCDTPRNLTDEMMLKIRDTNGLVGINGANFLVSKDHNRQTIETTVELIKYMADKIGAEHLGFGFDFYEFLESNAVDSCGGTGSPSIKGLEDCSKIPQLLQMLKKAGFSDDELEGMKYKNWHRVIKEIIG